MHKKAGIFAGTVTSERPVGVPKRQAASARESLTAWSLIALGWLCASSGGVLAAEINVMISGGFFSAYKTLIPRFEQSTGHKLVTIYGPSMGTASDAIPVRLERGEMADVVIMAAPALDKLIDQGKADRDGRTDLATSSIGMAVRSGTRKPDISSVAAFKQTVLEAKTIAYSDSASGVYLSTVLFKQLGIAEQMKDKRRSIPGAPAGLVVAKGEAEIAFQQISELLPVPGIDIVGPLPGEIQQVTTFSAGILVKANERNTARAFIQFLASPEAFAAIRNSGLEPSQTAGMNQK